MTSDIISPYMTLRKVRGTLVLDIYNLVYVTGYTKHDVVGVPLVVAIWDGECCTLMIRAVG